MLKKKLRRTLIAAITTSIGFPVGAYLIVCGAIKEMPVLIVLGIVLVLTGFYVMPMLWISYSNTAVSFARLLHAIEEEGITDISQLATVINKDLETTEQTIKNALEKQYLTGYIIENGKLVKIKKELGSEVNGITCSGCGARYKVSKKSKDNECPYCGRFN